MFGVPLSEMTPEVRRNAKAINFGIIYGISAFGLAKNIGIGRSEASAYIKTYFEKFPGIKDYMEEAKPKPVNMAILPPSWAANATSKAFAIATKCPAPSRSAKP